MTLEKRFERDAMPIVDRLVAKSIAAGLPGNVELDDLRQEGYVAAWKVMLKPTGSLPLDKQIATRARSAMVQYLKREYDYSSTHLSYDSSEMLHVHVFGD